MKQRAIALPVALAAAVALAGAAPAPAQEGARQTAQQQQATQQQQTTQQQATQQQTDRLDTQRWREIRDRTVGAKDLLAADVTSGFNPVGNVRDLVLNEDASQVEYVLYEVPYPYQLYGADNGYVAFENVAVDPGVSFDLNLRFDDPADAEDPTTLELTREEADRRLVSRILGDTVSFAGEETRPLEDILIDRQTGRITHYVVNNNPDAWFNDEPRAIPAAEVAISDEGEVTASTEFAALEPVEIQ